MTFIIIIFSEVVSRPFTRVYSNSLRFGVRPTKSGENRVVFVHSLVSVFSNKKRWTKNIKLGRGGFSYCLGSLFVLMCYVETHKTVSDIKVVMK